MTRQTSFRPEGALRELRLRVRAGGAAALTRQQHRHAEAVGQDVLAHHRTMIPTGWPRPGSCQALDPQKPSSSEEAW